MDGGKGLNTLVEAGDASMTLVTGTPKTNGSLTSTLGTDILVRNTIQAARRTGGPSNNTLGASAFKGPVYLFGLGGDDILVGGPKTDVPVGGDGNDSPYGNGGSDVPIGGLGADSLDGGKGGDLLVGGNTSLDADVISLAILTEWTKPGTAYKAHIGHLTGATPSGKNGAVVLNNTTVFDDAQPDTVTGGKGAGDWLFSSPGDVLNDVEKGETVTAIP